MDGAAMLEYFLFTLISSLDLHIDCFGGRFMLILSLSNSLPSLRYVLPCNLLIDLKP